MEKSKTRGKIRFKNRNFAPDMFDVILLNDDVTTMEFVVFILKSVFNKSEHEATQLMFAVHLKGSAVCGSYEKSVALAKQNSVLQMASSSGFPLRCIVKGK